MTFRACLFAMFLFLLSGCASGPRYFSSQNASGYANVKGEQCVPFARRVSGIQIRGDAYTWWQNAAGIYARGNMPAPGAVLVLSRTNKLKYGHVAVVKSVQAPREIMVSHTNWGSDKSTRRVAYETHRVQDISTNNDWTLVRFWNRDHNIFGFPYPAYGFIYNQKEY